MGKAQKKFYQQIILLVGERLNITKKLGVTRGGGEWQPTPSQRKICLGIEGDFRSKINIILRESRLTKLNYLKTWIPTHCSLTDGLRYPFHPNLTLIQAKTKYFLKYLKKQGLYKVPYSKPIWEAFHEKRGGKREEKNTKIKDFVVNI